MLTDGWKGPWLIHQLAGSGEGFILAVPKNWEKVQKNPEVTFSRSPFFLLTPPCGWSSSHLTVFLFSPLQTPEQLPLLPLTHDRGDQLSQRLYWLLHLVALLGLSFGICTRPGIPPCLTSGNLAPWPPWPQPWPSPSSRTPPQTTVVQLEIKPTHYFLPQIPALVHSLFPNSNGYKDGEWGISAKADKREVMLVSDEVMLQREESPQTCSAFYDLSWLFLSLPCSLTAVLTCKLEQI